MNKAQLLNNLKRQGFSKEILNAFSKVKREDFIPKILKEKAYEDTALSIGEGQTISQPYTIAVMLSMLNFKESQKVLELGSGCGYVLALMSEIVGKKGKVYGIEIIPELAKRSNLNLKGYKNIKIYNKDGKKGLEEQAPFDKILISAAIQEIPKEILSQLKDKGILVAPVGSRFEQSLVVIQRNKDDFKIKEQIQGFVFVPFVWLFCSKYFYFILLLSN